MVKLLRFLLVALSLLLPLQAAETADTRPVIKIGVLASLTGDMSYAGESYRNAMLMAQEERGKTRYRYQLIFEDCAYEATKAATALQKLLNVDKVDCVCPYFDMFTAISTPVVEAKHIPLLGYSMQRKVVYNKKFSFIHSEMAEDEADLFCKGLVKRHIKKVAVFTMKDPYCQLQREALLEKVKSYSIEITDDFLFNPSERDFRTLVARAKGKKPEIYCLLSFTPTLELLTKQLKSMGETAISGMEVAENSNDLKLFEGLWYVAPKNPGNGMRERYIKKYNSPLQLGDGHAYDIYNMLVDTFEKFPTKPTGEQVADALKNLKSADGTMGKAVNDGHNVFSNQPVEKIVKNGEPVDL